MRGFRVGGALAVAIVLAVGSASASSGTTIDGVSAVVGDGVLHASATATIRAEQPKVVATDPAGDALDPDLAPVASALGLDVTELALRHTGFNEVEFIITVAEMHVPPPHEVIRYLWQFKVNGKEYWVQAKMSDALSGTTFVDDPVGAVTHVNGAFRLRGNCQVVGVVSTCQHVMWIDGEFDVAAKQVRMRVPLNRPEAPHFVAGATIEPDDPMTASIQVLISNASTSDSVDVFETYTIPSMNLGFAVAGGDSDPSSLSYTLHGTAELSCTFWSVGGYVGGSPAEREPTTCSFTDTIDISALPSGSYALFARACLGDCGYGSAPFDL